MQMGNRESLWTHAWCLWFVLSLLPASQAEDQGQACHAGDLAALRKFSGGLDSPVPGWSANASSYCCLWAGVKCSSSSESAQRVIGLDLANNSLMGSVSDSLEALDQLEWLNLYNNSLKGVVPSGFFQFQRLTVLDLSMNEFSGEIPVNSSLGSIQVFNISGNMFAGSHPTLPGSRNLLQFDISYNLFSGGINTSICNNSPGVQVLSFSMNSFSGELPLGFGSCTSLRELFLGINEISGYLPEDIFSLSSLSKLNLVENQLSGRLSDRISNLSNLVVLDLSFNNFTGNIPNVLGKMKKLECFCAQSNRFWGALPSSFSNLSEIRVVDIRNNSLSGEINLNFSAMDHLSSLDLASNSFQGFIPEDLSKCLELKTLNLANNLLGGEIPESFENLVSLSYLSLSKNLFSNIAKALGVLQHCSNLTNLVLTKNFHGGEAIPVDGIQGFPKVEVLAIPNCGLSGSIPSWLNNCTKLKVLDMSWNYITGSIPPWLGDLNNLFYLDLSNNSITGEIPASLIQMKGLKSNLHQPNSLNDFPFFIKKNNSGKGLQYNQISSFPPSLILSSNKLVGPIPKSFGNLSALHQLDLSFNRLNGSIPEELSGMSSLEFMDLSHNNLTGTIPSSLTKLTFLSRFSVAFNNLVGLVPTGGQFSTFSATDFEGNSGLCFFHSPSCSSSEPTESISGKGKNKAVIVGMAIGIGLGTTFLLAVVYLFVSRTRSRTKEDRFKQVADSNEHLESAGSKLVILFQNKEKQDQLTISDILKSTGNFDQANIIGCGGFGLVYMATLPDGSKVAIKRLSGDYGQMEREFQAEVEALSRAQHRNLVLLQGYCKIGNDRLLIYSYMENGSLDYWLHERYDYGNSLNWSKRLLIAQGAARGLAYLHLSCQPHILHRDIKSSNILLDGNFEAHLADFGLARLILPYNTHVTTDLVGTLGYIPPEYGQSSVATYNGDVYSFGVVLLELLTGKRPVDMTKPKSGRHLISWVVQMRKEKRENEVFDSFIYNKEHEDQMMKMLDIACFCLSENPKNRPSTQQLVTWLDDIGQDYNLMNLEQ